MATRSKPAPKPRNRAAQEATLINIRALKRRLGTLEQTVKAQADRLAVCENAIALAQHEARDDA